MTRSQRPIWLGEDGRGWDHARIHRQLLEDGRLGVYEIGIYVGLAIHAETMSGSCRPAAATLARYVKCGERRAREALDRLEAAGYIRVEVQSGKASTYHLLPPPTLAPAAGVPDADPGTSSTDPGTVTRTTPAPRADEREPGEREPENETTPSVASAPAMAEDEGFDRFWRSFPKRNGRLIGKQDTARAWQRMPPISRAEALTAVGHYAAACNAPDGPLAMDPHRWLGKLRWKDWLEPVDTPPPARNGFSRSAILKRPDRLPLDEAIAVSLGVARPQIDRSAITAEAFELTEGTG